MNMQQTKELLRKVDLGCGSSKPAGFIGVDRMQMPGVDIIGDLDGVLPLERDSVDLLYASHSLEHARDIMHTMREVYRVCKHGAQVCIVAPYYEQKLNVANPYHLNVFNEHTPRFWTNSPVANLDDAEYWHPHAEAWGLAESDNSDPGLDFRLARMEFFYFPQYLLLSPEEKIEARRQYFDVCDQIMYHLVCWKPDGASDEQDVQKLIASMDFFEPEYVRERRERDLDTTRLLRAGGLGVRTLRAPLRQPDISHTEIIRLEEMIRALSDDLAKVKSEVVASHTATIQSLTMELNSERAKVTEYAQKLRSAEDEAARYRRRAAEAYASLASYGGMLEKAWIDGLISAHEVSLYRRRRIIRVVDRLVGRGMRNDLPAPFAPLLERESASAKVWYGPDLRNEAFVAYKIAVPKRQPEAIEVGLVQSIENLEETVGVEIVDSNNEIIWHSVQTIDGMAGGPVRFSLDFPLSQKDGEFEVRLFSGSKVAPVYPLEVIPSRFSRTRRVLARWCYR